MKEACHTYTDYKTDMIADCLNKDCRLLASVLAGQTLPSIETVSCVGNQARDKLRTAIFLRFMKMVATR